MKKEKREKLSLESKMVYFPPEPSSMSISDPIYMASNFQYIATHNLRIPEDLSVIGFDDIKLVKFLVPPLTTIKQPLREIGEEALNCMMEIIKNPNKACRTISLNIRLEKRESTQLITKERA